VSDPSINEVRSRLWPFYPTPEEQDLWLESPHPLLDGDSPYRRLYDGDGDSVLALIDQLESGAVV
jgi:hypothetical protein